MKKLPKIVMIGAGSASFGSDVIREAFTTRELWGSELVFMDKNQVTLSKMVKIAERINRELNANYLIKSTINRCEALEGADFVIIAIAIDRNKMWKYDFEIPRKYGIRHVLGENGGPGSLFHTMRNVPIILDICRDMEKLCPNALLINFTNPESRICLAISKYTRIKAVGLCHQIGAGFDMVSHITGRKRNNIDIKAAGLNHFTWMLDIRDLSTGEDLYPELIEKEKSFDPEYERLSRYIFHKFGIFPVPGDGHLGEYIPFAAEMMSDKGFDFDEDDIFRIDIDKFIEDIGNGVLPIDTPVCNDWFGPDSSLVAPSNEDAFTIIKGMTFNTNEYIISANLPNNGSISNLPDDAIVEIPAMVGGFGIRGLFMGELPRGAAALCSSQIAVQHLAVDAGATGDEALAMQALLVDPNVPSAKAAESIFEELMRINKPYLPQFK